MILKQEEKSAIIVGNIQQNTVGIDAKNVNFITNLLTEKLYSKPIQSFLRETVSNAYDSHIEAKSDEPVLIKIDYDNNKKYVISVRDYGTGLSPERFNLIYKNIGSSTKRESDDYIGALGIGRFSCLSVSNDCTITSYYNGVKDIYLMYKDEGTVHIDKLSSTPTKEHNGIEVSVKIKSEYNTASNIIEGIENLSFFSQIYVQNNTSISLNSNFNKRIVRKYDNFCYVIPQNIDKNTYFDFEEINNYRDYQVLYGDVLYPVSFRNLSLPFYCLPYKDLYLKFNIGELDITPSRESLQMTTKTITAIKNKFAAYEKEVSDKIAVTVNGFDSITKLLNCITPNPNNCDFRIPFDVIDGKKVYATYSSQMFNSIINVNPLSTTYKGKVINISPQIKKFIVQTFSDWRMDLNFNCRYKFSYNKTNRVLDKIALRNILSLINAGTVFVCTDKNVSAQIQQYVREQSGKSNLILASKQNEKEMIKGLYLTISSAARGCNLSIPNDVFKAILYDAGQWYFSKRRLISKKKLPQDFMTRWEHDHPKEVKAKAEKKAVEGIAYWGFMPNRDSFIRMSEAYVKAFKGTVYVFDKNSANIEVAKRMFTYFRCWDDDTLFFRNDRTLVIAVAKNNIPYCQSLGFLTETEFFSCNNPLFKKIAAIKLWEKNTGINLTYARNCMERAYASFAVSMQRIAEFRAQKYYIEGLERSRHLYDDCFKDIVENCIANNLVDWKLFINLPNIKELQLVAFLSKLCPTNLDTNVWEIELMRRKLIPFDAKRFKFSKEKINECIKGRW